MISWRGVCKWLAWGLASTLGGLLAACVCIYVVYLGFGYLYSFSNTPRSEDCPSEAEAKTHFLRHERDFQTLQSIYDRHSTETIDGDSTLRARVDSLSRLVACKRSTSNYYYYFEGGTILAGTDMFFAYLPNITELQSKFPMDYQLVQGSEDLHEATHSKESKYKHLKGDWYIGLSRY